MSKTLKLLSPVLLIAALSACDTAKQPATEQVSAHSIEQSLGTLQGGLIKEVLSGGGYTYVKVERAGQELWAAGPESKLEVGNLVAWHNSPSMYNFTSKSLNRTFAEIAFVSQFVDPSTQIANGESQQIAPQQHAPKHTPQQVTPADMGGTIKEVLASGGYTYVNVDINGQDVWAAGPTKALNIGESVSWQGGSKMTNFTSSTLGKTFTEIYFVNAFIEGNAANVAENVAETTSGTVDQVFASAGYSYIEVTSEGKSVWLAAPETSLQAGDNINWHGGAVMKNFKSSSLDKIFAEIIFVSAVSKV